MKSGRKYSTMNAQKNNTCFVTEKLLIVFKMESEICNQLYISAK